MKRIIITLTILGVTLAALRGAGPALTARAKQKCMEMFEGTSGPCPPKQTTACSEASCSCSSPAGQ